MIVATRLLLVGLACAGWGAVWMLVFRPAAGM
jgi:hypothetical protein